MYTIHNVLNEHLILCVKVLGRAAAYTCGVETCFCLWGADCIHGKWSSRLLCQCALFRTYASIAVSPQEDVGVSLQLDAAGFIYFA